MPVNKSARYRFEVIDECLRNPKKKWSKAELLRYVNNRLEYQLGSEKGISASQLRYDLESMEREYGAPIERYREGKGYYYRYEDDSFSIRSLPVEEEDLTKLNSAVQILRQIKGFTIADDIAGIVEKLEQRYKLSEAPANTIISFESAPELEGIEHLEDIYQAIIRKNVLKISYQTFKEDQPRIFHIHPYMLREYSHRWYLFGYAAEKAAPVVFALDRMRNIRVVKQPFVENSFVNNEDYFRDVIGVTVMAGSRAEEIELLFSGFFAPYILTRPLHKSQEIVMQHEDGSLQVKLCIIINPEFKNILLGYGKGVKVLRPSGLAAEMRATAQEIMAQYEE